MNKRNIEYKMTSMPEWQDEVGWLHEMAEKRWELVSVIKRNQSEYYIFKRPIVDEYLRALSAEVEQANKDRDETQTEWAKGRAWGIGMALSLYTN